MYWNNVPLLFDKYPSELEAVSGKIKNAKYLCITIPRIVLFNRTMPCLESSYSKVNSVMNKGMGKYKLIVMIQIEYLGLQNSNYWTLIIMLFILLI